MPPAAGRALTWADIDGLDFAKCAGLLPVIVQDNLTAQVLMLGYMNREALEATLSRGRVVFFSRARQRLWEKGETSGHALEVQSIHADCDHDSLLVSARPRGATCHLGVPSCFATEPPARSFLDTLEGVIRERLSEPGAESYTARLMSAGPMRIAQKVGEEGVELALAGCAGSTVEVTAEAADLLYHVLVLLQARGLSLARVLEELASRHTARR